MSNQNLKFSGHESFHCRPFWLKKGFDHVKAGKSFNDGSVVELGVGRNMVGSIRFWLRAVGLLTDKDQLTSIATNIFDNNGWDPFLEDEATLWLLHYQLIATNFASTYPIIFTELRKLRPEFNKNHFLSKIFELDSSQSENVVSKDFSVFVRNYFAKPSDDKEESFSGLFTELDLVQDVGNEHQKNQRFHIRNSKQSSIPLEVVLYCILDNESYGNSISFKSLMLDQKGVGNIFAFSQEGLENKLIEIGENVSGVVYKNDAGVKELQFKKKKPSGTELLSKYYNNEK